MSSITIYLLSNVFSICFMGHESDLWESKLRLVPSYPVVQSPCCSVALSCLTFATPWIAACQASLSFTISSSLLRLMSVESMIPSTHLILSYPLLPSIFPSIRVFSKKLALCIRWPKYWSFSFSPDEYSGLISFRINWFDLLPVQGTLKSLSSTAVGKHQFFSLSLLYGPNSHIRMWLLEKS